MNPYFESLRTLWQNPDFKPKHVSINQERLEAVARDLAMKELPLPQWREEVFPQADNDTFIDFLIVSGAINYCFTDFKTGKKYDVEYPKGSGKIWYGSYAMFAALKRAMDEGIDILNPRFLSKLDLDETYYIFRHVSTAIPMVGSRLGQLRYLGEDSFRASFAEEFNFLDFREVAGCVEHLTLQYSRSYEDESYWPALDDPQVDEPGVKEYYLEFNKRAQLVPMMYHGRAMASGGALQPIRDPENFGPICDYQVPKALRHLGVVEYAPELASKVDNGVVIKRESREEIELRMLGCAQPMCLLLERINDLRPGFGLPKITMAELDNAIWRLGRNLPQDVNKHHYTYTTAY